jgi:hypothetical protein
VEEYALDVAGTIAGFSDPQGSVRHAPTSERGIVASVYDAVQQFTESSSRGFTPTASISSTPVAAHKTSDGPSTPALVLPVRTSDPDVPVLSGLKGPWAAPTTEKWDGRGLLISGSALEGARGTHHSSAMSVSLDAGSIVLNNALRSFTSPVRIVARRTTLPPEGDSATSASNAVETIAAPAATTSDEAWAGDWREWNDPAAISRKVFLCKLPLSCTEEELLAALSSFGEVRRIELWQDRAEPVRRSIAAYESSMEDTQSFQGGLEGFGLQEPSSERPQKHTANSFTRPPLEGSQHVLSGSGTGRMRSPQHSALPSDSELDDDPLWFRSRSHDDEVNVPDDMHAGDVVDDVMSVENVAAPWGDPGHAAYDDIMDSADLAAGAQVAGAADVASSFINSDGIVEEAEEAADITSTVGADVIEACGSTSDPSSSLPTSAPAEDEAALFAYDDLSLLDLYDGCSQYQFQPSTTTTRRGAAPLGNSVFYGTAGTAPQQQHGAMRSISYLTEGSLLRAAFLRAVQSSRGLFSAISRRGVHASPVSESPPPVSALYSASALWPAGTGAGQKLARQIEASRKRAAAGSHPGTSANKSLDHSGRRSPQSGGAHQLQPCASPRPANSRREPKRSVAWKDLQRVRRNFSIASPLTAFVYFETPEEVCAVCRRAI